MPLLHPITRARFNGTSNSTKEIPMSATDFKPAVLTDDQVHFDRAARVLEPWDESRARALLGTLSQGAVVLAVPRGRPLEGGPAIAQKLLTGFWNVTHADTGDSWSASADDLADFGPIMAVADPATAPEDVDKSEDFWPEAFTSSDRYPYTSIVYGSSPSGKIFAYMRTSALDEGGDGESARPYWKPLVPGAPAMPDALADTLCTGWTVVVAFGGRIGTNPYISDTDNAQEAK